MAINNITDLKEQVLDKPGTKLSPKELQALNSVDKKTYDGMKDAIAAQKFELKDNKGVVCKNVWLKDILSNFDTRDNTFKIQNHEFQVGTKTELSAWIQLYLIVNGKSVYNDKQGDPTKKLGIDGIVGEHTKSAIDNLKNGTKVSTVEHINETVSNKISLREIKNHNFKQDFINLFGKKVAEEYQTKYALFNDGPLNRVQFFEKKDTKPSAINVYYKPSHGGALDGTTGLYISSKEVVDSAGNVDITKFLKIVKQRIDDGELRIKMKPLFDDINSAKDNVKVENFSPLIKTYLDAKDWVTNGDLDLKGGIGTGLEVKEQNLSVIFPAGREYLIPIANIQTAGKFDEKKLIVELTKILKPQADDWKNSLN